MTFRWAVSQRGIAVITVLLALAIAVLISSEVIMRVYWGMKRTESQLNAEQAWQYALGGEAWARQQLAADYAHDKSSQKVDWFREDWALPAQTLKVDGGFIELEIYDMQSRFNLNNLIDDKGQIVIEQVNIFSRLLAYLGVNAGYADLAARWASYVRDTGNEYGTEELPYLAGDTQFGSVSELRLLRDMDLAQYQKLVPFVSALPLPVKININTAPEPVLASLTKTANQERLQQFLQMRDSRETGLSSGSEFINMMGVQDNSLTKDDVAVSSEYFEVRVRTQYNDRKAYLVSTLFRNAETGEIVLLSRDRSQRFVFMNSALEPGQSAGKDGDENDADEKDRKKRKSSTRTGRDDGNE